MAGPPRHHVTPRQQLAPVRRRAAVYQPSGRGRAAGAPAAGAGRRRPDPGTSGRGPRRSSAVRHCRRPARCAVRPATVLERDDGPDLCFADPRRDRRHHAIPERHDRRVADERVAELLRPGGTGDDRDRRGEVDRELALQPCLRVRLPVSSSTSGCTARSIRSIWSGVNLCAARSWRHASIVGCRTIPQANGL